MKTMAQHKSGICDLKSQVHGVYPRLAISIRCFDPNVGNNLALVTERPAPNRFCWPTPKLRKPVSDFFVSTSRLRLRGVGKCYNRGSQTLPDHVPHQNFDNFAYTHKFLMTNMLRKITKICLPIGI